MVIWGVATPEIIKFSSSVYYPPNGLGTLQEHSTAIFSFYAYWCPKNGLSAGVLQTFEGPFLIGLLGDVTPPPPDA